MNDFFSKLFQQELPNEGIIIVIITSITALVSNLIERRIKKRKKAIEGTAGPMIQTAFDELKFTVEDLRSTQDDLRHELTDVEEQVDRWREMYYDQVEHNTKLTSEVEILKLQVEKLLSN
jgi:peptidoglycan hydrolase CwlO-like protein